MVSICCVQSMTIRPGLPIVLITGHPEMLDRLPAAGASHYRLFKKPFDGQELLTAISDAMRSPRLSGPDRDLQR